MNKKKENDEYRITCKCGEYLDSKVIESETDPKIKSAYYNLHMRHIFGGKMENIFTIKVNGEVQAMDYHTAFDKDWILEEIKGLLDKTEPDDVIEIINVAKNNRK